jgi:hypothetical protein
MTDGDRSKRPDDLLARLVCIDPPAELDRMVLGRARVVLEEHAARQRVLAERALRQRALEEEAEPRLERKLVTGASF